MESSWDEFCPRLSSPLGGGFRSPGLRSVEGTGAERSRVELVFALNRGWDCDCRRV